MCVYVCMYGGVRYGGVMQVRVFGLWLRGEFGIEWSVDKGGYLGDWKKNSYVFR